MSEILEYLRRMQAEMDAKDPLLKQGVGKDWVCVINPAIEYKLRQKAIEVHGNHIHVHMFGLDMVTGRKTFVENDAPEMEVRYMPYETYLATYSEAIIARLKHHTEDDAS